MRRQCYFRQSDRGLLAWDVDGLIQKSRDLSPRRVLIASLRELDEPCCGETERPTWRQLLEHIRLMDEADLSCPIILGEAGDVMDGRHRLAQAARSGHAEILAVQFPRDPEPDHVGRTPDELPYD